MTLCLTTLILLSTLYALFAKPLPCPPDCQCFPLHHNDLKIECRWPVIPGPEIFTVFPAELANTLTISCTNMLASSSLSAGIFSPLSRLRHLSLSGCQSNPNLLPKELFRGLTSLRTLSIATQTARAGPLKIEPGTFKGLESLEKLELPNNRLESLPDTEFCDLKDLKWLNFSKNHLKDIQRLGFTDCPTQTVMLDLSRNDFESIPAGSLERFQQLHLLDLSFNKIAAISTGSLQGGQNLRKLSLEANQISLFEENIAEVANQLKVLDLSANQLVILPESLINLDSMTRLNLSRNSIESLESLTLNLPHLLSLDLSHNRLTRIPTGLFDNSSSLTSIFFNDNQIESISPYAFRDLQSLISIDLSQNRLSVLQHDSFYQLQHLEQLHLQQNEIEKLPENFFAGVPKLTRLDLSRNQLSSVPMAVTVLYFLSDLNLAENRINVTHKFLFDRLPNLRNLILTGNQLAELDRYVLENVPKLELLDLSANRIKSLASQCFRKTARLKFLHLQDNQIESINGVFSNLNLLQMLNLTNNRLKHVDFLMLPENLTSIFASHNAIVSLSNYLNRSVRIQEIDFSHNNLTTLATNVLPQSLQIGNFSFNRLEEIGDKALELMERLESLDFRQNQIKELNRSSVELQRIFVNPPVIYLAGNPLRCTCNTEWLKVLQSGTFGSNKLPMVADFDLLTCASELDPAAKPVPISSLPKTDFLCSYDLVCSDECPCCEFDSCDCKNACPLGCSCYRDAAFVENIVKCTENQHPVSIRKIPIYATSIHLDGINLRMVGRLDFLGRHRLRELYLNNSQIQMIEPKAFATLTSLKYLDLSDNQLTSLSGKEFFTVPKLAKVDLSRNRLQEIADTFFQRLPKLSELLLAENNFTSLPSGLVSKETPPKIVTISENPWKCDCGERFALQSWLPQHISRVPDFKSVYCFENIRDPVNQTVLSLLPPREGGIVKVNFWTFRSEMNATFCPDAKPLTPIGTENVDSRHSHVDVDFDVSVFETNNLTMIGIAAVCVLCVILVAAIIGWRFRTMSKYRLKNRKQLPPNLSALNVDISPLSVGSGGSSCPFLQYDAFVAYSQHDQAFVHKEISGRLEQEVPYYELCLLHRDSLLSADDYVTSRQHVDDAIIAAMAKSQRILIILTERFLQVEWKLLHIRTALMCASKDRHRKLLFIVVGEMKLQQIDTILGHLMRTNDCISNSDPLFWEKIKEALPDKILSSPLNSTTSTDLYGTIVPSEFV